jgi:hypothetical protein
MEPKSTLSEVGQKVPLVIYTAVRGSPILILTHDRYLAFVSYIISKLL